MLDSVLVVHSLSLQARALKYTMALNPKGLTPMHAKRHHAFAVLQASSLEVWIYCIAGLWRLESQTAQKCFKNGAPCPRRNHKEMLHF